MFQVLKSPGWRKGLLAGSLFLVLGWGWLQTPEAGTWLFPERFWGSQVDRAQGKLLRAQRSLDEEEARLEALRKAQRRGFPHLSGNSPPTKKGLHMALARVQAERQYARENKLLLEEMLRSYHRLEHKSDKQVRKFK